ncbi:oligosaccharide flippase family protein [Marinobacter sp.]|uniref:oligosaccharide flippase family protein n=1 Tax=Marinobacter sp. TaxID=50741 RepID=UPI002B279604|nr:oligosaccharide flippase family protein [Marinobacter sp.]
MISVRGRFLKLLFGPVITLMVGVLSGPLISRLFTPEEFGRYSALLALVGIGVVVVTLRFDQLIPTSKDPACSFWIAVAGAVVGSTVLGFGVSPFIAANELLFVVLATVSVAIFNAFYYLRVNADQPFKASAGKAIQATGVLGGQAAFGGVGWGSAGLLWGELCGRLASLLFLFQKVEQRRLPQLKVEFREQWPAAKWMMPGALMGAIALQLLPLGMAFSVGAAAAGVFLLLYRMIVIPNSLLSKVASDTLLIELSRLARSDKPMSDAVEKSLGKLFLTAVCLYGSLAIYGGWIFSVLLGEKWSASVELIPWLALLVGFWSLASPLSMVFVSTKRTRFSFWLSCLDIVNRCVALVFGFLFQDVLVAAIALACGGVVVYGVTVASALRLAKGSLIRVLHSVCLSAGAGVSLLVFGWALFAHGAWLASLFASAIAFCVCGKKVLYG